MWEKGPLNRRQAPADEFFPASIQSPFSLLPLKWIIADWEHCDIMMKISV